MSSDETITDIPRETISESKGEAFVPAEINVFAPNTISLPFPISFTDEEFPMEGRIGGSIF